VRYAFVFHERAPPVGFLDDLKRQADVVKARQTTDTGVLDRNAMLADGACNAVMRYFGTLAHQLNVLQPASKVTYRLDKLHAFSGLQLCEFRADSRMKRLRGGEVFDHVVLRCKLKSGQSLMIEKDFPPQVDKLEARLRQSGAFFESEKIRDPDNGRWLATRFTASADFNIAVFATPNHDAGWVHFKLSNLDGFENVTVDFPAIEIGTARLDELARWLMGEPHAFLKDGQNLRRIEV
jgi:hypothetical protein